MAATSKADRGLADQLTDSVVNKLVEQGFTSSRAPTVEDIQDIVESTLIDSGNSDIAKAYIVYRHERRKLQYVVSKMNHVETSVQSVSHHMLFEIRKRKTSSDHFLKLFDQFRA